MGRFRNPLESRAWRKRAYLPVQHGGGRNHVRASLRVGKAGLDQQFQGCFIVEVVVLEHSAMAVGRVLAEANVGDDEQPGNIFLHGPHGLLDEACRGVGAKSALVFVLRVGNPKQ